MVQAQNNPFVSYNDLANTSPKSPAIIAPIIPPGIPAKWGMPNNIAEIVKKL